MQPKDPASATRICVRRWATLSGLLFLIGLPVSAQQGGTIAGRVIDATSQRPLAGVQVVVSGTPRGVVSDASGRFAITGVAGVEVTLQAILIGYRTTTVSAQVGDMSVRIALDQSAVSLDELVVTGTAGAQRVRSLGNSVGRVQVGEVMQIAPPTADNVSSAPVGYGYRREFPINVQLQRMDSELAAPMRTPVHCASTSVISFT